MNTLKPTLLALAILCCLTHEVNAAPRPYILVISIDGMGADYLMPANGAFEGRSTDGEKVEPADPSVHYDHPDDLRETLASDIPSKSDITIDERRFAWTLAILRLHKPGFMATHLGELDHAEHFF